MKTLKFMPCRALLIFIVLLLMQQLALAQNFTKSKTIERAFKVDASATVDITNKYGKVHIVPWNNDSVKFKIDLTVQSKDSVKMKNIFNNIDFDFTTTSFYLSVKTILGSNLPSFFVDIQRLTQALSSESQVTIDYTVMVPNYVNITIDNKYGDVYADNIKSNFQLTLSNGDFKINNLTGDTDIDLKFGNGQINSINTGRIVVAYGELDIGIAEQLNVNSKSSKITIETIDMLKGQSRRDKYHINSINFLYGSTYFSDYWVQELKQEASIDLKYGSLNFNAIRKTFSFINITAEYTDLQLFFERGASYELDLTHTDVNLQYPENIANVQEKQVENNRKQYITYGTIGSGTASGKVRISAVDCNVLITHK